MMVEKIYLVVCRSENYFFLSHRSQNLQVVAKGVIGHFIRPKILSVKKFIFKINIHP